MYTDWKGVKNVLCIRPDNMGDVLMSSPAFLALKKTFGCRITLLTSSQGQKIARYIPCIDDTIVYNVPWIKASTHDDAESFNAVIKKIKEKNFDAAVVFTVFSQNPLPSVMFAYLAGIPRRLAYCRENPYALLTNWVPDKEPLQLIRHQVSRDLELVNAVGATIDKPLLSLEVPWRAYSTINEKIKNAGVDTNLKWLIVHAGASELKRQYPLQRLRTLIKKMTSELNVHVLLTGTSEEKQITDELGRGMGKNVTSVAGLFSLDEFMALIDIAPLVISVNTSTIHIAAALKTPVIVLYAMTNPQHTPWMAEHRIFPFPVPKQLNTKNEVLLYAQENLIDKVEEMPAEDQIINCVREYI